MGNEELTSLERDEAGPALVELPSHRVMRASAGAGKTYRLTGRYLGLLGAGVDPGTILATTFTRKAAGEILGRVLQWPAKAAVDASARRGLSEQVGRELSEADCRAMLVKLVRSLHRLSVSTIDSFFNRVAGTFRFELDIPPDPQLVDEGHPLVRQLRLEAIEAMLADRDVTVLLELLRQLQHDAATRRVTEVLEQEIGQAFYEVYRQAPQRSAWSRIEVPEGELDEPELQEAIARLAEQGPGTLPKHKAWEKDFAGNVEAARLGDWDALLSKGPIGAIVAGKERHRGKEIPAELEALARPVIDHAEAKTIGDVARQSRAYHSLLGRFDEHYTRMRRQQRLMLFSDLTHKLARYLPSQGEDVLWEVYYRLDSQVGHLLLDEFQDTSLEQWQVLGPFAKEILDQGPAEYSGRTFFCVGDTKQAIYGWRGGCAELFDVVEQAVPGENRETLKRSWRSSPVVLEAVNRAFGRIGSCPELGEDADVAERWEATFPEHEAVKAELAGHVRLMTSRPEPEVGAGEDGEEAEELGGAHERFVAEQVKALHARAPGASIGVLVSRNRTVNRLIHEMRRAGLHVSGEGGNPIADVPAVAAVLSALRLADHPGHTAAAFHVANSPMGPVVGLDGTEPGEVARVARRSRRPLLSEGSAGVLARWVRGLASSCDGRGLARLTQLVELAERYGTMATLRPGQFVSFVEARPVEEPTPASIRVMTVHASKGLEFDQVVLPELDRRFSNRWTILVEREEPTGPITGVYRYAKESVRDRLPEVAKAYEAQRCQQRVEDLCNLYVAMTRARRGLHMILRPRGRKANGEPTALPPSFGAILRHGLSEVEEHLEGEQVLYERGEPNWAGPTETAEGGSAAEAGDAEATGASSTGEAEEEAPGLGLTLSAEEGALRRGWLTLSPSSLSGDGRVRAEELLEIEAGEGQARGTLIHAWMERVGFVEEDGLPGEAELWEVAQQVVPGATEVWVRQQLADWRAMVARPEVRQVLGRGGTKELWRERAFAVRDAGRLVRGVFDRVTVEREPDGSVAGATLVDFKTDRVRDEAGLEATARRYRPQVEAYRRALGRLLGVEPARVGARLVFLEAGRVVAVG